MSTNSEQERERMKEEYKEHYRQIREAREKLRRSKYVRNVNEAMQKLNADELLHSVDDFLGSVRTKMSQFEARLDVAMDELMNEEQQQAERDEEMKKVRARDTLKQIKQEMGLLYSEIEHQAEQLDVKKTVGKQDEKPSDDNTQ
jgi:hypothetical protein